MKIKDILLATLLASASLMGLSASAATVGKTESVNLVNDAVGGYNAHFGNEFSGVDTLNLFVDKYLFTLGNSFDSAASITSSFLQSGTIKDLLISNFSIVHYDPISNAILHTYGGSNTSTGMSDTWELTASGLGAGSYYVEVNGQVLGDGGGSYGSSLNLAVAAVPEPATYGLMAAGLGVLGLVARRRTSPRA